MKSSFALAFLLVGFPILFVLREFIPVSKALFTYSLIGVNLLILINYKNLIHSKYYSSLTPLISVSIFIVLFFFIIGSVSANGFNDQTMYLMIVMYLYFCFFTLRGEEMNQFYKYVLILSSVAVYMAYIFTPTDAAYWALNGNRFYVGDTENPGLVSALTLINIITIFIYFFQKKKKALHTLLLIPLFFISPYLYFLSQGKSTFIGLLTILIFLLFKSDLKPFKKALFALKARTLLIIVLVIVVGVLFSDYLESFFNLIINTAKTLFGLSTSDTVMSASVRNENFEKTWELISYDNFVGYGINTFRMDSPFLQTAIDFGNIIALMLFISAFLYPLYLLVKIDFIKLDINTKMAILYYLFNVQNFFFHGTPYEYSFWIPILYFYKFVSSRKVRM